MWKLIEKNKPNKISIECANRLRQILTGNWALFSTIITIIRWNIPATSWLSHQQFNAFYFVLVFVLEQWKPFVPVNNLHLYNWKQADVIRLAFLHISLITATIWTSLVRLLFGTVFFSLRLSSLGTQYSVCILLFTWIKLANKQSDFAIKILRLSTLRVGHLCHSKMTLVFSRKNIR